MRVRDRLIFALAAVIVACGVWGFFWEPSRLSVVEHDLPLKHWPASLNGLRIAAISDIHAGSPWIDREKLERMVALTNAAKPDVIVLLGDYVIQNVPGGKFFPPEDLAKILAGLKAPQGVYAVTGNHDQWLDATRVMKAFKAENIRVLHNHAVKLPGGFWLMGIAYMRDFRIAEVLAEQVKDDAPVIMLTHGPDIFPAVPPRVNLMLAGHTHGGQVNLPLVGRMIVPSVYGKRYAAGHVREQTDLFVTTGVGTSIIPVRFGVPPEISLLTVRADG